MMKGFARLCFLVAVVGAGQLTRMESTGLLQVQHRGQMKTDIITKLASGDDLEDIAADNSSNEAVNTVNETVHTISGEEEPNGKAGLTSMTTDVEKGVEAVQAAQVNRK